MCLATVTVPDERGVWRTLQKKRTRTVDGQITVAFSLVNFVSTAPVAPESESVDGEPVSISVAESVQVSSVDAPVSSVAASVSSPEWVPTGAVPRTVVLVSSSDSTSRPLSLSLSVLLKRQGKEKNSGKKNGHGRKRIPVTGSVRANRGRGPVTRAGAPRYCQIHHSIHSPAGFFQTEVWGAGRSAPEAPGKTAPEKEGHSPDL
jgi:hypothetical protein